jgi:hypothetical protein
VLRQDVAQASAPPGVRAKRARARTSRTAAAATGPLRAAPRREASLGSRWRCSSCSGGLDGCAMRGNGVSVSRILRVCSERFMWMTASAGLTTDLSSMKSPRWLSSSSPIGVSRLRGCPPSSCSPRSARVRAPVPTQRRARAGERSHVETAELGSRPRCARQGGTGRVCSDAVTTEGYAGAHGRPARRTRCSQPYGQERVQFSMKLLSCFEREGWRSLRRALASI